MPTKFVPGVEQGLASVVAAGVLAGFPVVALKVTLIDGAYHEIDSSTLAFEIAARAALREALQKGGSVLLEPVITLELVTPQRYTGSIIADLKLRRGRIQDRNVHRNSDVIVAMVPLANMFGYIDALRSISKGRAVCTMQFDHYEEAPWRGDDPPFPPAIGMRV